MYTSTYLLTSVFLSHRIYEVWAKRTLLAEFAWGSRPEISECSVENPLFTSNYFHVCYRQSDSVHYLTNKALTYFHCHEYGRIAIGLYHLRQFVHSWCRHFFVYFTYEERLQHQTTHFLRNTL